MAYIRKRGKGWYVEIRKLGVEKHATFDSKTQAAKWAADTEALIVAGKASGVPDITFRALMERYRDEVSSKKRGEKWEKTRINLLLEDEIANVKLVELDQPHIAGWRDRRLKSVSAASVRREWNILSAACSTAVDEWKWLPKHPMKGVKRPEAPQSRDRRINEKEIDTLLYILGYDGNTPSTISARVGAAFLFAIETGMRAGEIAGLTWDRVYLDKSYLKTFGKTRAAYRDVPLSPKAIEILKSLDRNEDSVFCLKTQQIDALFRKAKDRALIKDLHFHDSRAEAVTRLASKLDINALARAIGHKDLRMLQVYYRESAEDIAKKLR
jgi:integrase